MQRTWGESSLFPTSFLLSTSISLEQRPGKSFVRRTYCSTAQMQLEILLRRLVTFFFSGASSDVCTVCPLQNKDDLGKKIGISGTFAVATFYCQISHRLLVSKREVTIMTV